MQTLQRLQNIVETDWPVLVHGGDDNMVIAVYHFGIDRPKTHGVDIPLEHIQDSIKKRNDDTQGVFDRQVEVIRKRLAR